MQLFMESVAAKTDAHGWCYVGHDPAELDNLEPYYRSAPCVVKTRLGKHQSCFQTEGRNFMPNPGRHFGPAANCCHVHAAGILFHLDRHPACDPIKLLACSVQLVFVIHLL